jgi:hypothetical protein
MPASPEQADGTEDARFGNGACTLLTAVLSLGRCISRTLPWEANILSLRCSREEKIFYF